MNANNIYDGLLPDATLEYLRLHHGDEVSLIRDKSSIIITQKGTSIAIMCLIGALSGETIYMVIPYREIGKIYYVDGMIQYPKTEQIMQLREKGLIS